MQIERIIQLMQTDDSVDAPREVIDRAKQIFRQAMPEPGASLLQRIVAVLQADLRPDRAAFGERSASAMKSRQLLYTAGETGIDLRVDDFAGRLDVRGQLLGDEIGSGGVRLFNNEHSFESRADEFGEFQFRSVVTGTYSMSIAAGEREIFIEKIDLH